ncbi:MAG: NADH-quinone oxidoreductase subunit D [Candidatus Omnitrophota bacterium]
MDARPISNPHSSRSMMLNVGPQHPAMHGIIRIAVEIEGETVLGADVDIGYLHRGFEKMCEQGPYNNAIPYTDRLNYVSPLINNFGYCMAVEKLLDVEVPERCQYIRLILSELSRLTDHLTCVGATTMELGMMTAFLYLMKAREYLYDVIDGVTGARVTNSYGRIGGVKADLPDDFKARTKKAVADVRRVLAEIKPMLDQNRIFLDRLKGVGVVSRETAVGYGITGPFLRSTGIDYDVRKNNPYFVYDRLDFDVPVGTVGDNYDRYLVRIEEMHQSMRLVEQALARIPGGPVRNTQFDSAVLEGAAMVDDAKMGRTMGMLDTRANTDPTLEGTGRTFEGGVRIADKQVALPAKEDVYGNIEGLMNHFKLVMHGHGIRPRSAEAYAPVEGANGELGFYIISDGTDKPYRVRVRPPCFPIMAALGKILIGGQFADIVPTFGSVNMIGGELDR